MSLEKASCGNWTFDQYFYQNYFKKWTYSQNIRMLIQISIATCIFLRVFKQKDVFSKSNTSY